VSLPEGSTVDVFLSQDSFNVAVAQAVAAGLGPPVSSANVTISSVSVVAPGKRRRLREERRLAETVSLQILYSVRLADAAAAADLVQVLSTSKGKDEFEQRFTDVLQQEQSVTVHSMDVQLQQASSESQDTAATTAEPEAEGGGNTTVLVASGLACTILICGVWMALRIKWASYRVFSSIVPGEERKNDLNRRAAKRIQELKEMQKG